MMMSKRLAVALLGLAVALGSGCAKPPPPPPPTVVQGTLVVDTAANPDGRGRASPIIVRVLELKSLSPFGTADFFELWDRPRETLQANLVEFDDYEMRPGEQRQFERKPGVEVKYLAVIAAYRDLERASWRSTLPIVANQTQAIFVTVEARKVTLSRK